MLRDDGHAVSPRKGTVKVLGQIGLGKLSHMGVMGDNLRSFRLKFTNQMIGRGIPGVIRVFKICNADDSNLGFLEANLFFLEDRFDHLSHMHGHVFINPPRQTDELCLHGPVAISLESVAEKPCIFWQAVTPNPGAGQMHMPLRARID